MPETISPVPVPLNPPDPTARGTLERGTAVVFPGGAVGEGKGRKVLLPGGRGGAVTVVADF
jgi:hypothetical protein